ncbi:MAG TPA: prolyl-tRNA synthetase associated domain-containing protein, partial [Rhodospirillales bacterium]|nr:prolyl-tRNA synthetase associated domain-containing protein [Rhodospirillales bacterium]
MSERSDPAPASTEILLARLESLGISVRTHSHAAVFTVEENKAVRDGLPGGHCKNLFLKDKKGALWLIVCCEDRAIDM